MPVRNDKTKSVEFVEFSEFVELIELLEFVEFVELLGFVASVEIAGLPRPDKSGLAKTGKLSSSAGELIRAGTRPAPTSMIQAPPIYPTWVRIS